MDNTMRCSMTGMPVTGPADAIWDDGEWISWDYINRDLYEQDLIKRFPKAPLAVIQIFEELVVIAEQYHDLTGRYLQIWGELGELFAEISYGIKRHVPGTQGSDGCIGNDLVEIKTLSPEKGNGTVSVKRGGNFTKLLLVKISGDFEFTSRLIDRTELSTGTGKHAKFKWVSEKE